MPAEWEPHAATWLSWPHNPETWPGAMGPIPAVWAELVAALTTGERVNLLVSPAVEVEAVEQALAAAAVDRTRVALHEVPTNDAWLRDSGPTFVVRRGEAPGTALIDWDYNAWGGKYAPWGRRR